MEVRSPVSRRQCLRLIALSAATMLGACLPGAPAPTPTPPSGPAPAVKTASQPAGPQTMTLWAFSLTPDVIKYLNEKVTPDFQRQYPAIAVTVQHVPYQGYRDKLATALAGGTLPDIHEEGTQVAGRAATSGEAIPVDDYIKNWPDKDDIFPIAWQTAFYGGYHWGVPFFAQPSATLYWKSLFQEVGLDPHKAPADEEEYAANARKLQKIERGAIARLGGWAPSTGQALFQEFEVCLQRRGGKIADENYTHPLFNSPEGESALQYLVDLFQFVYPKDVARLPEETPIPHFAQKKIAQHFRGHSNEAENVLKYNPQAWDDLGIARPLVAKGGSRPVSIQWRNMLFVAPTSRLRAEAMEWIRTFVTTEHNGEYNRLMGYIPIRKSALNLPWVKESKYVGTYLQIAMPYGYDVVNPPQYFELRQKSTSFLEAAALGKMNIKEALQKVFEIWAEGLKSTPPIRLP